MAPHGQFTFVNGDPENIQTEPPVPAVRHADLFKNVKSMWMIATTMRFDNPKGNLILQHDSSTHSTL